MRSASQGLLLPLGLWLATLWLLAQSAQAAWYSDSQDIMGTRVSAQLWLEGADADSRAQEALAAVMAEMHRIDRDYSPYKEASQLSRANRLAPQASAAAPLSISPELALLIARALHYGELSSGAFDITYASVGRYYDYRAGRQPSSTERTQALPAINYRHVHLVAPANAGADPGLWFAHPQVYIDLGGIAKGYAVDLAIELLRQRGIAHALVSAGGDSRLLGDKRGQPWMVGIRNPRAERGTAAITLPLDNCSVSTSGDYERYFVDDQGERVHHIINPRTGSSAQGIMSATVIGPEGFDTDALSTSVFVLGVEQGLALINRLPGFDAIIITSSGKVHYSNGLAPPAP